MFPAQCMANLPGFLQLATWVSAVELVVDPSGSTSIRSRASAVLCESCDNKACSPRWSMSCVLSLCCICEATRAVSTGHLSDFIWKGLGGTFFSRRFFISRLRNVVLSQNLWKGGIPHSSTPHWYIFKGAVSLTYLFSVLPRMVYVNCLFVWLARSQNSRVSYLPRVFLIRKTRVACVLNTEHNLVAAEGYEPSTSASRDTAFCECRERLRVRLAYLFVWPLAVFQAAVLANLSSISCTFQLAFCFCLAFGFPCWSCAIGSSVSPSYFVFSGFVFRFLPLIFSAEVDLGWARCFRCCSRFNIIFNLRLYKLSWFASIIALKVLLKHIFALIASMIVAGDCAFSLFLCWLVARL